MMAETASKLKNVISQLERVLKDNKDSRYKYLQLKAAKSGYSTTIAYSLCLNDYVSTVYYNNYMHLCLSQPI